MSSVTKVGAHQDGDMGMPSVHDLISRSSSWGGPLLALLDSGTRAFFQDGLSPRALCAMGID